MLSFRQPSSREVLSALPVRTRAWFLLLACLFAPLTASAEVCDAPPALESQLHARPEAGAYAALGAWFDENHKTDCALQAFQAALQADPNSPEALNGLAKALTAAGHDPTVTWLLRMARRDPKLTLDLARAYRKAQIFDAAAEVLNDGLKSYPDSDQLTAALVSLDVLVSHYAAAQTLSAQLARRKPGDLEAQRIYLRTLVITGNNDLALPLGRKLLARAPHDADLLNLNGLLEHKAGDDAAARRHLEEAVALNPDDENPRVNLGVVLAQLGDAAGAKQQLERAIALGADAPQVYFELAKALRALGETEAAQRQLQLYQQKLKADADQSLAVLKATEAAQAEKAGDARKAADLYRDALAAEPANANLAYRLAMALDSLGDNAGERAALMQAIQANPDFVLAQYQLGYLDFEAGDNPAAEARFRIVVRDAPGNAQAWISLAATLGAELRFQQARDAVAKALQLEPNNAGARELSSKLAAAENRP